GRLRPPVAPAGCSGKSCSHSATTPGRVAMDSSRLDRKVLVLAVVAVLGAGWAPAHAQQAAEPGAGEEEATTLSAITVTAQKREEALQDVPIAITVLPEQLLQDNGVRD